MAVAKDKAPGFKKKASLLNRILLAIFSLTLLGWFVLQSFAAFLWGTEGFDKAFASIERLSLLQAGVASEFEGHSMASYLNERLSPDFRQKTHHLTLHAKALSQKATEKASHILQDFADEHRVPKESVGSTLQEMSLFASQVWELSKAVSHVLLVKLLIVIAAIPLFILSSLAGLVDGLNQRAIRTASLGRESTYVFHKSIPLARRTIFWVLALWLALPIPMPPSPIFVGLSVLLSLVVSMSANRFKKYL